jgi:hypothetical protein
MNAKQVLSKIISALSNEKEVVNFTYAKMADGTILESPTFDLGEKVEVVSEDGTKTPAPNGEHEVVLKDSEGNDVRIKVMTKDGIITERENVEVETPAADEAMKAEDVEVKPLPGDPGTGYPHQKTDTKMESIAGEDIGGGEGGDEIDEEVEPIAEDMKSVIEKMAYRISEMEKKMQSMEEAAKPSEETKKEADIKMEEEELPKLDGAPVEENAFTNASKDKQKFGKIVGSPQNTFLSKLYK